MGDHSTYLPVSAGNNLQIEMCHTSGHELIYGRATTAGAAHHADSAYSCWELKKLNVPIWQQTPKQENSTQG